MKKITLLDVFTYSFLILGSLLVLIPLYLSVVTAFKTAEEMNRNFFALPAQLNLENFKNILSRGSYYQALYNTTFITIISLVFMVILLPMTAYPIARNMHTNKFYKFLYFFLLAGLFIPFQVKMLPLVKLINQLGLMNRVGMTILYLSGSTCEGIFLFVGYLMSLPSELEEAAYIDGASTFKIYYRIILPLIKPITATIVIKNALWMWNDFFMPILILNKSASYRTLTLFQYTFKSEYSTNYTLAFATFVVSMLPIMVLYVILQKNIISGLTDGSVKG